MNKCIKISKWDKAVIGMGAALLIAGILFVVAQLLQASIMGFYSEIMILTFLPVVLIYFWTEKVVSWLNIDSKVLDAVALLVRITAIIIFIVFAGSHLVDLYMDLPYAITSDYAYVKGVPIRAMDAAINEKDKYFAVNGVSFIYGEKNLGLVNKNSNYSITYLPHSKYIIEIHQENAFSTKKMD